MELLVQKYLRSGKTLEMLKAEHGVNYHICNGKIGLTYDQLEAKESNLLAQQCRGLILREGSYDKVAVPMFRFFNLAQEELAANIDWNSASYFNKLDGSLIIVYFDDKQNRWYCGTRSRPEADGGINGSDMTFSKLLDETIKDQFKDLDEEKFSKPTDLNSLMDEWYPKEARKYTFCFELTGPLNRIVCKYQDHRITLLAVRDNDTLKESDPAEWSFPDRGLNTPEVYSFNNINHLIQVVKEWSPEYYEGVVVRDKNFNRVKVKNPSYVAYNHMRDSLATSVRGCVEIILLGKEDDVINMMPEMIANRIKRLKPAVQQVFKTTLEDYEKIKHIDNMREFASKAELCLWPPALYALKRKKTDDLKSFAMGGKRFKGSKIPSSSVDNIFNLCKKVDPTLSKMGGFDL